MIRNRTIVGILLLSVAVVAISVAGVTALSSQAEVQSEAGNVNALATNNDEHDVHIEAVNQSITTAEALTVEFTSVPESDLTLVVESVDGQELYTTTVTGQEIPTVFRLTNVPVGEYIVTVENETNDVTDETEVITVTEPTEDDIDGSDLLLLDRGPYSNATIGPGEETFIHAFAVVDPANDGDSALIENISVDLGSLNPADIDEVRLEAGSSLTDMRSIATAGGAAIDESPSGFVVFEDLGENGASNYELPDGAANRFEIYVRLTSDTDGAFGLLPATSVTLASDSPKTFSHSQRTGYEQPEAWTFFDSRGPVATDAVAFSPSENLSFADDDDLGTLVEVSFTTGIAYETTEPRYEAPSTSDFLLYTADGISLANPDRILDLSHGDTRVLLDIGDHHPSDIQYVSADGGFTDINGNEVSGGLTPVTTTNVTLSKTGHQQKPLEVGSNESVALLGQSRNEYISVVHPSGETIISNRTGFDSQVSTFDTSEATPGTTYNVSFQCECDEKTIRQIHVVDDSQDHPVSLSIEANKSEFKPTENMTLTVTSSEQMDVLLTVEDVSEGTTAIQTQFAVDGTTELSFGTPPIGEYIITIENDVFEISDSGQISVVTRVEMIDGSTPQDLNGDGLHRDLNANGRLDTHDVVLFFNYLDHESVTNHGEAYDFDQNGRVSTLDVITLFNRLSINCC